MFVNHLAAVSVRTIAPSHLTPTNRAKFANIKEPAGAGMEIVATLSCLTDVDIVYKGSKYRLLEDAELETDQGMPTPRA